MSIDVKELWSMVERVKSLRHRLSIMGGHLLLDELASIIEAWIVAVIADRDAKPDAAGDVPEWKTRFATAVRDRIHNAGCWSVDFVLQVASEEASHLEAEIARQVERQSRPISCHMLSKGGDCDCTMCRQDAKIADLTAKLAEAKQERDCIKRDNTAIRAEHAKQLADRDAEIERLKTECANRKEIEDVLSKRIDEERATVERLTNFYTEAQSAINTLRLEANAENARLKAESSPGALANARDRIRSQEKQIEELKAELAEARKPVEGVDWTKLGVHMEQWLQNPARGCNRDWLKQTFEPLLRAARLAAEFAAKSMEEAAKVGADMLAAERADRQRTMDAHLLFESHRELSGEWVARRRGILDAPEAGRGATLHDAVRAAYDKERPQESING
jgi:hypothetical protein